MLSNASVPFLLFALGVILIAAMRRDTVWRGGVLLTASAVFLWLCSAGALWPLLLFIALGFAGLKLIESGNGRALAPLAAVTVLAYIWLKQYTFIPSQIFLKNPYTTLGLSYILFRILHLMADANSGMLPGRVGLLPYLAYTLNFTTLVAGPIQRYQDFWERWREPKRLSLVDASLAVERIIVGFFKVNVMSLIFSLMQTRAIAHLTESTDVQSRIVYGAITVAAYPFFLYCNFSGYIDVVIGIARLMRMDLPENFNRPFSADSFLSFWSRWHITLSEWLKTYVYNPLVMNLMRRFPADSLASVWGVFAYFVTFFLVGVWHGRTSAFLFFGVLQGLGVSMNKLYEIVLTRRLGRKRAKALAGNAIYSAIGRGLTFTWFAFTLIWFWSNWSQIGALATSMGGAAVIVGALGLILVCASVGLALWEAGRHLLLDMDWGSAVLQSRYTRTAWCTALGLVALIIGLLMSQSTPEIVYKAF